MRVSSLEKLFNLVLICLTWIRSCEAGLVRYDKQTDTAEMVFSEVIPGYRFFGAKTGTFENLEIMVFGQGNQQLFCDVTQKTVTMNFSNHLIIISPDLDLTCNNENGNLNNLRYVKAICEAFQAPVLAPYSLMVWNGHDGSRFEDLYGLNPSLRDCPYLEVKPMEDVAKEFIEECCSSTSNCSHYRFNLTIDENVEVAVFDHIFVQGILYRAIPCILHIFLVLRALKIAWDRYRDNKVVTNTVHKMVLVITIYSNLTLGIITAIGPLRFIGPQHSFVTVMMFYVEFFGALLAMQFLLGILYKQAYQKLLRPRFDDDVTRRKGMIATSPVLFFFAFLLVLLDFVGFVMFIDIGPSSAVVALELVPMVFISLQVYILVFMVRSSLKIARLIKDVDLSGSSHTAPHMKALTKRLYYLVKVGICTAAIYLGLFLYISIVYGAFIPVSAYVYVVCGFLQIMSRFVLNNVCVSAVAPTIAKSLKSSAVKPTFMFTASEQKTTQCDTES